jgi:hypothetical protein
MVTTKGYTVKQFITALSKHPKDATVLMSSDEEGSTYKPIRKITKAHEEGPEAKEGFLILLYPKITKIKAAQR